MGRCVFTDNPLLLATFLRPFYAKARPPDETDTDLKEDVGFLELGGSSILLADEQRGKHYLLPTYSGIRFGLEELC